MSDARTPADPFDGAPEVPLELRVHGVGGPQAAKMLGERDEHDVITVPSFTAVVSGDDPRRPGEIVTRRVSVPKDGETRFAQRTIGGRTEAYEWGGLTVASAAKALWILYLPFTLINAGGWGHAAQPSSEHRVGGWLRDPTSAAVRAHQGLTHLASYLATITYVLWISYLAMELVAHRWVEHARMWGFRADIATCPTLTSNVVLVWVPRIAPVLGLIVVAAVFASPVRRGRYEGANAGATAKEIASSWPSVPSPGSPAFFAREQAHGRLLARHAIVAGVTAAAALAQYIASWNRLGAALLGVAAVQGVIIAVLLACDVLARWRHRPSEVFEELLPDTELRDAPSLAPAGAAFVLVGTALAHSAFAGLALLLARFLGGWPSIDGDRLATTRGAMAELKDTGLALGPELRGSDVLAWVLGLSALVAVVVLFTSPKPAVEVSPAGSVQPGYALRLARNVPRLLIGLVVAIALPVLMFTFLNVRGILDAQKPGAPAAVTLGAAHPAPAAEVACHGWDRVRCWYDGYEADDGAIAKQAGSLVLLILPGIAYACLRGKHDTGIGRIIGNVWDVLTFWPRRFHPYAAPCSAERAVPELRARIVHIGEALGSTNRLVVVAHSQGSVLSVAAVSSLPVDAAVPSLVTFGSPLGTLYLPTWPAYVPLLLVGARQRVGSEEPWVNFWRGTDPVGAQVPGAVNEHLLEPQSEAVVDLQDIEDRRPLERPPRWGTTAGHGLYLAAARVRDEIARRRLATRKGST